MLSPSFHRPLKKPTRFGINSRSRSAKSFDDKKWTKVFPQDGSTIMDAWEDISYFHKLSQFVYPLVPSRKIKTINQRRLTLFSWKRKSRVIQLIFHRAHWDFGLSIIR